MAAELNRPSSAKDAMLSCNTDTAATFVGELGVAGLTVVAPFLAAPARAMQDSWHGFASS